MQIKSFEFFVVAAEARSFAEAAEILFTTQSSVSKQIFALEKELGVELFDRSRRKAVLTPAGECCFQYAKTICKIHGEMVQTISTMTPAPSNQLRVAFIPVAIYYVLDKLHEFGQKNPCAQLTLVEHELSDILSGLDKGLYDVALLWERALDESIYQAIELYQDQVVVLINSKNPLASMKQISIHQLKKETFLMLDNKTGMMDLCLQACRNIGGFEPKVLHQGSHIESIVDMVSKNLGVCMMMNIPAQSIRREGLQVLPLLEDITNTLVLARPRNRPATPKGEHLWAFFDEAVRELKSPAHINPKQ